MNVLKYAGKHSTELYDISTPEKRAKAFSLIFNFLEDWGVYTDMEKDQKALYKKAKKGDAKATEELLWMRSDYEYEEIAMVSLTNPLEVDES